MAEKTPALVPNEIDGQPPRGRTIKDLKMEYIWYYRQLPVQKLAASFIGRDEDTIINWRKADKVFADEVDRAKSEWTRYQAARTRPEFLLERILKETFAPPKPDEADSQPPSVNITVIENAPFEINRPEYQADPEADDSLDAAA